MRADALLHPMVQPSETDHRSNAGAASLPRVNAAAGGPDVLCAFLIPGAARLPDKIGASSAATGRGWRHPTSHVQAIRRLEGERDGSRSRRSARRSLAGCQQWRSSRGLKPPIALPKGTAPGKQAGPSRSGMQIAGARAPKGSPWGGKPPLESLRALHWLRSRCPRPRRTLAGPAGGALGAGRTCVRERRACERALRQPGLVRSLQEQRDQTLRVRPHDNRQQANGRQRAR
jgi:hypothetical protein